MFVRTLDDRMHIIVPRGERLELIAGAAGIFAELYVGEGSRFESDLWETAKDAVVDVVIQSEKKP